MSGRLLTYVGLVAVLVGCAGCPQYRDASVPNEITREKEPAAGARYLLYVPSTYDRELAWPLVILCHGAKPWDTPLRQMRDWVKFAEERGFIVAAPELTGTSGFPKRRAEKQVARQMEDEERIFGAVRHIVGAYHIAESRVFLTGWSAGNFAVLYTGLKNPDVFRALVLQQGNFNAQYLGDLVGRIDRHQPVGVIYGSGDVLTGPDSRECVDWLADQGANVYPLEVSGGHRGHPEDAMAFFERVLRNEPWLHIRTLPAEGADPLAVQFKTRASFAPRAYRWQFGDGGESLVAQPVHLYEQPGTYQVLLEAADPKGKRVRRAVEVRVPLRGAFCAEPTTWEES